MAAAPAMVPHVVLVPVPSQGHINPFTSLAHCLAASGASVTLVHSARTLSLLSPPPSSTAASAAAITPADAAPHGRGAGALPIPIRIERMPDGIKPTERLSLDAFTAAIPVMSSGLEAILQKLMREDNPPCCLISDALLPWCHDVALKCGLPEVLVWVGSASVFSLVFHIPELLARGYIPATDEESQARIIDFISGLSPLRIADLPDGMRAEGGLHSTSFEFLCSSYTHLRSADSVLVNSMYELETEVVDALRTKGGVQVEPVGPLSLMSSHSSTSQSTASSSLLQEDTSCLTWLDQQKASSVIYVSFGSIAAVEGDVFKELAHGLEASKQRFLWVIRPDAHKDKAHTAAAELLPEGFAERTRGRGLVISWAPQLAVLAHPSVGGFLTHCGWNSVMESLSYGIPMLGFPQVAEQNTNLKLIVDVWKVGMAVLGEQGACKLERARVERLVTAIIEGSGEGAEVRRRAMEWRDRAHRAVELHGTSRCALQHLVDDLRDGRFGSKLAPQRAEPLWM